MLTAPIFESVEGAYLDLLRLATEQPEHRIDARGNAAREVIGVAFRLTDPRQRLPYLAERKANPVFQFAEALWYLAGRRDLEMIGYYAPSMRASSADGVRLGGSAYGYTLFSPRGASQSQFDQVVELLLNEPDSKRGYLPVFAAKELRDRDNPDVACLAGLHLLPRDGRLHMVCHMRANDLDCGLLSDVFSFTMIQEYAAIQLGLQLGTYTHTIGSAHVNDANAERVKRVLDEADSRPAAPSFTFPAMPESTEGATIAQVLRHEAALRTNELRYSTAHITSLDLAPYWQQVVMLFELYRQIQHDQRAAVDPDLLAALHPGLRWLMERKWPACAAAAVGRTR
ncbi:thymidylate synthase [Streptomyces canus]|uniref:thymidylate synthase n=1 Tax=Streptomyces canus TaxID=58343 RepID=A0AAW8F3S7_9ACTN|nr:thymidylate synthase [Streptomyces canus]MDQ0904482.1 thymidylate synthase [Streptomyces canus]